MNRLKAIEWVSGKVKIIDQTRLPWEEVIREIDNYREVAADFQNPLCSEQCAPRCLCEGSVAHQHGS